MRGKLVSPNFHEFLVTQYGPSIWETPESGVSTGMSVTCYASMSAVANTYLSYSQEYKVSSSPFQPGLIASTTTPEKSFRTFGLLGSKKARLRWGFITNPRVYFVLLVCRYCYQCAPDEGFILCSALVPLADHSMLRINKVNILEDAMNHIDGRDFCHLSSESLQQPIIRVDLPASSLETNLF